MYISGIIDGSSSMCPLLSYYLMQVEYVEFERHGAGGASMSSHYFDLLVKLKNDQEHLFRNIQRNEYHNLFNFVRYMFLIDLIISV